MLDKVTVDRASMYQSVFGSEMGKKVLADIRRCSGIDGKVTVGTPVDVPDVFMQLGRRSLFVDIRHYVELNLSDKEPETVNTKETDNG
jgi:hypothetical protein